MTCFSLFIIITYHQTKNVFFCFISLDVDIFRIPPQKLFWLFRLRVNNFLFKWVFRLPSVPKPTKHNEQWIVIGPCVSTSCAAWASVHLKVIFCTNDNWTFFRFLWHDKLPNGTSLHRYYRITRCILNWPCTWSENLQDYRSPFCRLPFILFCCDFIVLCLIVLKIIVEHCVVPPILHSICKKVIITAEATTEFQS